MRQTLLVMLLVAVGVVPALAKVTVESIVVDRVLPDTAWTITVQVANTGAKVATLDGVKLQLKTATTWQTVKRWDEAKQILPGQILTFRVTPDTFSHLGSTLTRSNYELQALVSAHRVGASWSSSNR